MRRTALVALFALVALLVLLAAWTPGPALAQEGNSFVRGEPHLDVFTPRPTLTPGETTQLSVQVTNDGEIAGGAAGNRALVTTARAVTVDVSADATPLTVETRRQAIGSVLDGQVREVPLTVTVPAGTEPGEYTLDVALSYSYTSVYAPKSGVVQEETATVTRTLTVEVPERPRFTMRTVETDAQVGGPGTVTVAVTNTGTETASDLTVALESSSPNVVLGGAGRDTARLARLAPDETRTVAYDVTLRPGTTDRTYPLTGTVGYTDPDGVRHTEAPRSLGFRPAAEQSFEVSVTDSTLRVGESGVLTGTVRNEGPVAAEDVAVTLGNASFRPRVGSYAVGGLAVDETATFRFRGTVPSAADATPQRVTVTTRYRTVDSTDRTATDTLRVPVAERRDGVAVSAVDPQFVAGESGRLDVRLRNRHDAEIRDVRVFLNATDPLESDFPSTVVSRLAPNETGRVAFDVDVDGGALETQYPAVVVVQYTVAGTDRPTVQTETLAVDVSATERDVPLVELGAALLVLVVVVVGGWWLYGERLV